MKRMIITGAGLLGVFLGVGLILPALAKVRDLGAMPSDRLTPYTLGVALVILGVSTAAFSLLKRKAA